MHPRRSNTGGAWDNAKKYIEAGASEHARELGGKGSDSTRCVLRGGCSIGFVDGGLGDEEEREGRELETPTQPVKPDASNCLQTNPTQPNQTKPNHSNPTHPTPYHRPPSSATPWATP